MITSQFIRSILGMLLDGDETEMPALNKQVEFLTENEYEYTDVGLFLSFQHQNGINQYTVSQERGIYAGLYISPTEFQEEAEARLFIIDGLIDYLEIWAFMGKYPGKELESYILRQFWKGDRGKIISYP